jgi:histidinol-phosphatase (PHP family)
MQKIKMDFHVHSDFSPDSPSPMIDMIKKAMEVGITDLAFTEHVDLDYDVTDPGHDWNFDQDTYFDAIRQYQNDYHEKIRLYAGVEIGMQPHLGIKNQSIVDARPFDFVIGSLHSVDGSDLYKRVYFDRHPSDRAVEHYYEQYLECISDFEGYDVLGHLDLYIRYEAKTKTVAMKSYFDVLEALLRKVIESGKGIELNAGGFRYGLGQNNPGMDIMKLYKTLGGEVLTLGSDAHTPDQLGVEYDRNIERMKSLGFKYICTFKDRKPTFHKI